MRKGNQLYARALMALLWGTDSLLDNDKLCIEAKEKRLYRWGTPKQGEFVSRRILDGFKQLKSMIGKNNELIFLKLSFAIACKEEYERKFPNGDELQILLVVE